MRTQQKVPELKNRGEKRRGWEAGVPTPSS